MMLSGSSRVMRLEVCFDEVIGRCRSRGVL